MGACILAACVPSTFTCCPCCCCLSWGCCTVCRAVGVTTTVGGPGGAAHSPKLAEWWEADMLNAVTDENTTSLMAAATRGNVEVVRLLLQNPR